jgi:hypothetical protein
VFANRILEIHRMNSTCGFLAAAWWIVDEQFGLPRPSVPFAILTSSTATAAMAGSAVERRARLRRSATFSTHHPLFQDVATEE